MIYDFDDAPGVCDPREFTRRALEDYAAFCLKFAGVWRQTNARLGAGGLVARSLEAEACSVYVALFRESYDDHTVRVLPFCLELSDTPRRN